MDLAADSVLVEVVSVRTLEAGVHTPHLAAEVVIQLGQEGGVGEVSCGQLELLGGDSSREKQHQAYEDSLNHLLNIISSSHKLELNIIAFK